MPITPTYPGVYIEEIKSGVRTINGVATSIAAFIGTAADTVTVPTDAPTTVNNYGDFERLFGGLSTAHLMSYAVRDFFVNGGGQAIIVRIGAATDTAVLGTRAAKTGMYALEKVDLFNILCIPPLGRTAGALNDIAGTTWVDAAAYCLERRAMLIVDPPTAWSTKDLAKEAAEIDSQNPDFAITHAAATAKNTVVYFPQIMQPDPLDNNNIKTFAPCGAIAGIIARTDAERGIWKAPAGLEATFNNVADLAISLTDAENGELNPLGVNCLRVKPPAGRLIWGARTWASPGGDPDWLYLPVRRLALYIEESLFRGTQWAVFEPNDEPLWAQIRLNLGSFMQTLFRQGAFAGKSPREAYFVKCDRETTTADDINKGIVNIVVGFAPLKPAEFVIIKLQQIAGQSN